MLVFMRKFFQGQEQILQKLKDSSNTSAHSTQPKNDSPVKKFQDFFHISNTLTSGLTVYLKGFIDQTDIKIKVLSQSAALKSQINSEIRKELGKLPSLALDTDVDSYVRRLETLSSSELSQKIAEQLIEIQFELCLAVQLTALSFIKTAIPVNVLSGVDLVLDSHNFYQQKIDNSTFTREDLTSYYVKYQQLQNQFTKFTNTSNLFKPLSIDATWLLSEAHKQLPSEEFLGDFDQDEFDCFLRSVFPQSEVIDAPQRDATLAEESVFNQPATLFVQADSTLPDWDLFLDDSKLLGNAQPVGAAAEEPINQTGALLEKTDRANRDLDSFFYNPTHSDKPGYAPRLDAASAENPVNQPTALFEQSKPPSDYLSLGSFPNLLSSDRILGNITPCTKRARFFQDASSSEAPVAAAKSPVEGINHG